MSLIFRLLMVIVGSFFKPRLGPLEKSVLKFRVLPNDLDVLGHMNNGRCLTLMDLGRIDVIIRTGFWKVVLCKKWCPLVGTVIIRFKRSLKLGETYELHTRILCWDEKWFYMEHHFMKRKNLIAFSWMKGLFRGPEGNIPSAEVVRLSGHKISSPPMPHDLARWVKVMPDREARPPDRQAGKKGR